MARQSSLSRSPAAARRMSWFLTGRDPDRREWRCCGGLQRDLEAKPGLKWSDGSDFTPDDIIFTWNCKDEATACTTASNFAPIGNVEAIDATTVKVHLEEPNPNSYVSFVGPADDCRRPSLRTASVPQR